MKKFLILAIAFLGMAMSVFSQDGKIFTDDKGRRYVKKGSQIIFFPALPSIACDCDSAIRIPFEQKGSYGPTSAPKGFGTVQEIKSGKKDDLYFFEMEHNSAWYYFDIKHDGELIFEITPEKAMDDYDFLLFRSAGNNFCNDLKNKKILPVRTNISRPLQESNVTGLSSASSKEFVHSGPGEKFSKPILVKKGERYYLVLDNVNPGGGGHTIALNYLRKVHFSGQVLDDNNTPIKSELTLEDVKGKELKKIETDAFGKYDFTMKVFGESRYNIVIYNDEHFVGVQEINIPKLGKEVSFTDIKTVLPKLRGGNKYQLNGINFLSGSAILAPISYSSVGALYKLMKKNSNMVIRIEGHINNPGQSAKAEDWGLSESRAKVIYDYLVSKGIDKSRMSMIGFGSTKMLFPNPKDEKEQSLNRRVEINVISF